MRLKKILLCGLPFISMLLTVPASRSAEQLKVSVSILPIKGLVEEIGKERVSVTVMVPPGANPHSFEPKPNELKALSSAEIYVKLGTPIEFELSWMPRFLKINPAMYVVDLSKGLELIRGNAPDGGNAGIEPHIWLSVRNMIKSARNICDALALKDPSNAGAYAAGLDLLTAKLSLLDKEFSALFPGKKKREFMVFHPSLAYFARDYGLTEFSIESEGKEPSARQLKSIIDRAKGAGIGTIFVYPETSQRSARTVAGQLGAGVEIIDPLRADYLENIRSIAKKIEGSL